MSEPGYEQLTLFPADSPASRLVLPGSEEARTMTATSGRKCLELYRKSGPPMQVVQALELAVSALRAGGTDTNVPTMPVGQPLTLEEAEERCKELEARCKRLDEARERANEAAHKWETMYRGKKEELEMSKDEVSTMSTAGMEMLNAFSEYVRSGSKNPAAYCYYGAAGCGGDGDGCKGVTHCSFLPKSGMKGG